ncbi:hypothetical protein [Neobacillus sp. CF12]|uniref:hypothetical protein n=1 Tax=Neobacillus sp. CF12 TaxID=3055864 RepID=UPI0025A2A334|nr:hypothetical protein [Neobacillus sp. CF12]MDM5326255.1 hypothetical protein [Neobacillus sp. CF12]
MSAKLTSDILLEQLEKLIFTKEEFQTLYDYCSNRNYGEEGIPVYLLLDDLTNDQGDTQSIQSGDPMFNLLLAKAANELLSYLQKEGHELTELDVAKAFELLAEKYFSINPGTPK